jgi:hypothetical protein
VGFIVKDAGNRLAQLAGFVQECGDFPNGKIGFRSLGKASQVFAADFDVHPLQALKRGHGAGFGESGHFDLSLVHYGVTRISPKLVVVFHHQVNHGGDQVAEDVGAAVPGGAAVDDLVSQGVEAANSAMIPSTTGVRSELTVPPCKCPGTEARKLSSPSNSAKRPAR